MSGNFARNTLEIRLDIIEANVRRLLLAVAPLKLIAVLKADAYGLGAGPIARACERAGANSIAVADLAEAMAIRPYTSLPILINGDILAEEIPGAVAAGFIIPVSSDSKAKLVSEESARQGRAAHCHFEVDTGMGRLGVRLDKAESILEWARLPGIECAGLYSHFPHAYGDADFSSAQVRTLLALHASLSSFGLKAPMLHIANSDGIHNIPEAIRPPMTHVRSGINLYGCFDEEGRRTFDLEEVLVLKSRLLAVRELPWGASLGYGRTCRLKQPTRVGTVPIGYADGLPLALSSGHGRFLVGGRSCSILGRISMDYTTINLDGVPEAREGDEVICLGNGIPIGEWSRAKKSISYEILCGIGGRVKRQYLDL